MATMTREQFFAALAPTVIRVRQEGSTMFPSVRLAQNLLETGGIIHAWNNLSGIKVGNGQTNAYWHGEAVVKGTWEYIDGRNVNTKAAFRAYPSLYDFYKDLDLLLATPRYDRVRKAESPERQAQMLLACGYATDPNYPLKLIAIIKQYSLRKYDLMGKPPVKPEKFRDAEIVAVVHRGQAVSDGYLVHGVTWVPARRVGELLGAVIDWNGKQVTVNGVALETILSNATGYVKVRDLADNLGLKAGWDAMARVVTID